MPNRKYAYLIFVLALGLAAAPYTAAPAFPPECLRFEGVPAKAEDLPPSVFSDLGAWHAYALPGPTDAKWRGGFAGPFLLTHRNGVWPGPCLAQLVITDLDAGRVLDPAEADFHAACPPGRLEQRLHWEANGITLEMELVFVSGRSSLIRVVLRNGRKTSCRLGLAWRGTLFPGQASVQPAPDGVTLRFPDPAACGALVLPKAAISDPEIGPSGYRLALAPRTLKTGESRETALGHGFAFSDAELARERAALRSRLDRPAASFEENRRRWDGYLRRLDRALLPCYRREPYRGLALKCLQTLLLNWRSPAGELRHAGLFPALHDRGFQGFWAWDSWKHAAALAALDPALAKEQVRALFDFQDGAGMVADCVFRDPAVETPNWRDTKPPLSAWAVWRIVRETGDRKFAQEMYPRLGKYHRWWYAHRDHDGNGLCEYGCSDGTLEAARWESGMDNAVRFDASRLLQNGDKAWSLDQESVDLNAYLCAEKRCLASLADAIDRRDEAAAWRREADRLQRALADRFFDPAAGYFRDRRLGDGGFVAADGAEGWIPLWAGAASPEQAAVVARALADPGRFATRVPFPSLSAGQPGFDPAGGYWRGPVWLDQAGFALEGLNRYGFQAQADAQFDQLLRNAEGLLEPSGAVRENYDPLSGRGLNARHFSWSAAHLLLRLTGRTGIPAP